MRRFSSNDHEGLALGSIGWSVIAEVSTGPVNAYVPVSWRDWAAIECYDSQNHRIVTRFVYAREYRQLFNAGDLKFQREGQSMPKHYPDPEKWYEQSRQDRRW